MEPDEIHNKGRVEKISLKSILLDNQQIIDVGSKVLSGIASLFIGAASIFFMMTQTKLQKIQLDISKSDNSPSIYVDSTPLFDDKTQKYNEEVLKLINSGGDAVKFSADIRSFIQINSYLSEEEGRKFTPIFDYYFATGYSRLPSGVLSTHRGHLNKLSMSKIHAETLSEEFKAEFGYNEFQLRHVIKVKFATKLGEAKTTYFYDGQPAITEDDIDYAEALYILHKKATSPYGPLDIDKTSANEIMKYVLTL